jgi:hypothetical protein
MLFRGLVEDRSVGAMRSFRIAPADVGLGVLTRNGFAVRAYEFNLE